MRWAPNRYSLSGQLRSRWTTIRSGVSPPERQPDRDSTRCAPGPGAAVRWIAPALLGMAILWLAGSTHLTTFAAAPGKPALLTLSIVGTSDLHGAALPADSVGGLPLLAGYVNNLRASRAADGGAVLLIDSGDTFLGTIESNL